MVKIVPWNFRVFVHYESCSSSNIFYFSYVLIIIIIIVTMKLEALMSVPT